MEMKYDVTKFDITLVKGYYDQLVRSLENPDGQNL